MTSPLLGSPAPTCCTSQRRTATLLSSSSSAYQRYHLSASAPRLGVLSFPLWSGLKQFTLSFQRNYTHSERKRNSSRMAVYASLFGVGAPEALVIGVVALLVFGPKGLAELHSVMEFHRKLISNNVSTTNPVLATSLTADIGCLIPSDSPANHSLDYRDPLIPSEIMQVARNLGKTLRSFQPTIRELQEVSREFKDTFEREIGLDEVTSTVKNSYRSNTIGNKSQQRISDPNGRPTAELNGELKKSKETLVDATTTPKAESPKEQTHDAPTSEPAASNPAPSGETASDVVEANVQVPSSERTITEGSKQG